MLIKIVREVTKMIMFIIFWGLPTLLAHWSADSSFLWFYIGSALGTIILFEHYERVAFIEHSTPLYIKSNPSITEKTNE